MSAPVLRQAPLLPDIGAADLARSLRQNHADAALEVGDERMLSFWQEVSGRLMARAPASPHPELAPLAHFLRARGLKAMLDRVRCPAPHVRAPRGLVLHLAPANVDTLFAYAWAVSAVVGNANIVRLSSRAGPAAEIVLDIVNQVMRDAAPSVGATQQVVSYETSSSCTEVLSSHCDLRVVWGGDETIRTVRRAPLPPHARDLTFPDRTSAAVFSATAWLAASQQIKDELTAALYNDAYWFDQAACSSPQTLYWIGSALDVDRAHSDLAQRLTSLVASRSHDIPPATGMHTLVQAHVLAASGAAESVTLGRPGPSWIRLARAADAPRSWLGIGVFPWARLSSLEELPGLVDRRVQTLTHAGLSDRELQDLAYQLRSLGVDRLVPVGRALDFTDVWDGYDLPRELTRIITIEGGRR